MTTQDGMTWDGLAECVTNLALKKTCYYVIHSTNFACYCADLACFIAHLRGFKDVRQKSKTTMALYNGGAELRFISIASPYLYGRIRNTRYGGEKRWRMTGLQIIAQPLAPVFIDHMVFKLSSPRETYMFP